MLFQGENSFAFFKNLVIMLEIKKGAMYTYDILRDNP